MRDRRGGSLAATEVRFFGVVFRDRGARIKPRPIALFFLKDLKMKECMDCDYTRKDLVHPENWDERQKKLMTDPEMKNALRSHPFRPHVSAAEMVQRIERVMKQDDVSDESVLSDIKFILSGGNPT